MKVLNRISIYRWLLQSKIWNKKKKHLPKNEYNFAQPLYTFDFIRVSPFIEIDKVTSTRLIFNDRSYNFQVSQTRYIAREI